MGEVRGNKRSDDHQRDEQGHERERQQYTGDRDGSRCKLQGMLPPGIHSAGRQQPPNSDNLG